MIEINPSQLHSDLASAFTIDEPAGLRCIGVMKGILRGRILVDDAARQTRALLQESIYGTIYLAGEWQPEPLATMIKTLRQQSEVMIGLWPDDPKITLLPEQNDYTGFVYDFYDHPSAKVLAPLTSNIPENCEIRRLDATLFEELIERDDLLAIYGSVEKSLQEVIGYCLLYKGQNVCEAITSPAIDGMLEMGIHTRKDYRRHGYATITAAALLQECERLGYKTFWNCNAENLPSVLLARRLGYQREKQYKLFYWKQAQE